MIDVGDFHFLRPYWLAALLPLAWLVWRLARGSFNAGKWQAVVDPALRPHVLLTTGPGGRRRGALVAFASAGLIATLALAGPTWSRLPQPVFRQQSALVIALDLSPGMDAVDLKPSRVARARFEIADLLRARKEGLTALIVYGGAPFMVTPLTTDTATIAAQVPVLSTDLMPAPGRDTQRALAKAEQLLHQAGYPRGDILLVTSGVDASRAVDYAGELRARGVRTFVLGVGTPSGGPVPEAGGYISDERGRIWTARLDTEALRELARAGGGAYRAVRGDDSDVRALLDSIAARPAERALATGLSARVWREQGPWLVLLLLPLSLLAFRRGYLVLLAALLPALGAPPPAHAADWDWLWRRPDQQAARELEAGDARSAARLFQDPAWRATAHYRAHDYAHALLASRPLEGADAWYNRGNALARLGRYRDAVGAYDRALALSPEDADARHNRDLLLKLLKPPPPTGGAGRQGGGGGGSAAKNGPGEEGQQRQQERGRGREAEERGKAESARPSPQERAGTPQPSPSARADQPQSREEREGQQAREQWLRRIPDDPGGLLRRKFLYQYQQGYDPDSS